MAWPDLSDIRNRVRDTLNESTALFWTDAELNRFINDGERDVAIKSLCLESILSKTTTASTRTIDIYRVKVLHIEYIPASGTPIGLVKIIPKQLGHLNLNTTIPQYWFPWAKKIGIEPLPDAAYDLNVYVASLPTIEMSADTDEPQIPDEFQELIIQYAIWKALCKDGLFQGVADIYNDYIYRLQFIRENIIRRYSDNKYEFKIPDKVSITSQS